MHRIGLSRPTRLLSRPVRILTVGAALTLALSACEEDLAPQITRFQIEPSCDVMFEHTRAVLDENGQPVLDENGDPIIEILGTWLDVNFFARASGGNRFDDPTGTNAALKFKWNFGDGKSATDVASGVHRYTTAGDYTISLVVEDKDGQTASISRDIFVGEVGTSVDVLSVGIAEGKSIPSLSGTGSTGRLYAIDITNPAAPFIAGNTVLPRPGRDIDIEGGIAYVALGLSGLGIYDVAAAPSAPPQRSLVEFRIDPETLDLASGVDAVGTTAYVALRTRIVMRVDASNPLAPVTTLADTILVTDMGEPGQGNDLVLAGTTAVITDGRGLITVDFADPQNPVVLSADVRTNGFAQDVAVSGNFALVADGVVGLEVFDLADVAGITQRGWYGTDGQVRSATIVGDYALLADDFGGIHVVHWNTGGSPTEVGFVHTPGVAFEIDVVGNFAYVANTGGLQILNIADLANPSIVGSVGTLGQAESIALSGNYAYVLVNGALNGWIADLEGSLITPCPVSGLVAQYTWEWTFGDSSTPQLHSAAPRHVYPVSPASYDVQLRVREEQSGVERSASATIQIPRY